MAMTECTIWQGSKDSSGYGTMRHGKKVVSVYRFAYELMYGEIAKGLVIDHECHNQALANGDCDGGKDCKHRACYNIEHLQATTRNNNQLFGVHGWGNKTTCKKGHELTDENIGVTPTQRYCKTCYDNSPSRRKVS